MAGAGTLPWHHGIAADDLAAAVRRFVSEVRVEELGGDVDLWGGTVSDERYALIART